MKKVIKVLIFASIIVTMPFSIYISLGVNGLLGQGKLDQVNMPLAILVGALLFAVLGSDIPSRWFPPKTNKTAVIWAVTFGIICFSLVFVTTNTIWIQTIIQNFRFTSLSLELFYLEDAYEPHLIYDVFRKLYLFLFTNQACTSGDYICRTLVEWGTSKLYSNFLVILLLSSLVGGTSGGLTIYQTKPAVD